jgi:hypothetical protein
MAKPKGSEKTGGRKKGTPNKRTQVFLEILEEQDFCVVRSSIRLYRKALRQFKEDQSDFRFKYLEIAQRGLMDLMQYQYPKRKSVEHTGADGEPILNTLVDLVKAVDAKSK